ncbi:alkaline phosphatase PafA [Pedobacter endophyticus]|uniref:Alkaline phosphatase family protein n=1 Tax=Pedobacter endophyticus TaxID=2789740 RepID=A0A7U3SPI8_9SPHI|nr:alkaline phosphatase PafA [Pedobacter endophyticus]QPH38558.1 alkaline phosphatase family protein [Pedobacter endophyticus]
MKHHLKFIIIILFGLNQTVCAQQDKKPKLVVGIIIDQMRAEYLYRFKDNYGENGFKRLMKTGFNVKNTHYNYVPTATGPGHASVYTGTTPSNHGIVSNHWYNRDTKKIMYCAEDTTAALIDNDDAQKNTKDKTFFRSPRNQKTTTITDELKLFTNNRAKVIGISLKDRAAIFPAGHLANAAFWYNSKNGNFITSSYYLNRLPLWLQQFNQKKKADSLLNLVWSTALPVERYINSKADHQNFEKIFKGKQNSVFPYDLKELRKTNGDFALLTEVPYGNTILTALALAALKGENLGKGAETDFLTISYSSTDYVGHNFGIRSKEIEDTYVRMDQEIALLLNALDTHLGKNEYTLFLTSDHAGSDHPRFLQANNLPGGFYHPKAIKEKLNSHLSKEFGPNKYIAYMDKTQIYFRETDTSKEDVLEASVKFLQSIDGIREAFIPGDPEWNLDNSTLSTFIKNTYNPAQSGDIIYHTYSGWMEELPFGTTHGTAFNSDTHVPLLWFGNGITRGETIKLHSITQVAPTLSFLLNIPLANASNPQPIEEIFER